MKSNIWISLTAIVITIIYCFMSRYEGHSFGDMGIAVVDKISGQVKLCTGTGCYVIKD